MPNFYCQIMIMDMFSSQDLLNQKKGLHQFALKLTRNAVNADDLLQSTLLRSLEKADMFQDGSNLFRWTSKIMFRLYLDTLRRGRLYAQCDAEKMIAVLPYKETQENFTDLDTVKAALKCLNAENRQILRLICLEDRSYKEAAMILNIPIGTVRSHLSRVRHSLDKALAANQQNVYIHDYGRSSFKNEKAAA